MSTVKAVPIHTGKRKTAIARVILKVGKGVITVNRRPLENYFPRKSLVFDLRKPLEVTQLLEKYDVFVTVTGGGVSGQAGAVRHAISNAIVAVHPETRGELRVHGYLTRDSRIVQRKMYGHKKARKSFQFSKR